MPSLNKPHSLCSYAVQYRNSFFDHFNSLNSVLNRHLRLLKYTFPPDFNWGQVKKTKVRRGESRGVEKTERRPSQRVYALSACSSLFSQKGALFIHLKELGEALSSPSRSLLVSISNCLFSHPVSVSFSFRYESFVLSLFSSSFCFPLLLLYSWRLN